MLKSKFNHFFYLLFTSRYGQFLLDGIISGSAQPKFNKTAFRNLLINYPNVSYIKEFETEVSFCFDKIDSNTNQIKTLETLRDTLLPKLMSGEVRVSL
jgi:type I restriction enzyme S subunit